MNIYESRSPAIDPATKPASPGGRVADRSSAETGSDPGTDSGTEKHSGTESAQTEVGRGIRLVNVASDREILLHGRRAFERGDDAAALESLLRLTAHGARFADVHYMIGMLHEREGEIEDALASLAEAIRINPSYVEALLALASLHERRGEFDRSQRYAERASQLSRPAAGGLDPTTRGKLANQQAALGDALAEAGERRDAIEQYRRALDRCPTFHDVRHRLGIALREAGLPAQAAQEFARILRLQPRMLESQVQLGLTYYSMGRTPEAIAEWNAVLEKDPSRDEARMYLRLVGATGLRASRVEKHDDLALDSLSTSLSTSTATTTPSVAAAAILRDTAGETADTDLEITAIPNQGPEPAAPGWSTTDLARPTREEQES